MHKCGCGMPISFYEKYCNECRENLSLRDKVIEDIRRDGVSNCSLNLKTKNTCNKLEEDACGLASGSKVRETLSSPVSLNLNNTKGGEE